MAQGVVLKPEAWCRRVVRVSASTRPPEVGLTSWRGCLELMA